MPQLRRKHPCSECPWLRRSAPGYLGADDPEHFYRASVTQERTPASAMPCHMEIDYSDPDWVHTQYPDADICAGNLVYFRNYMKSPRDPEMNAAVRSVSPSPHVFSTPGEFLTHHAGGYDDDAIRRVTQGWTPEDEDEPDSG